jgi:molybdopterin converting factor small subunit
MRIKVQFSSLVANIVGKQEEEVSLPEGARVRDMLGYLVEQYGDDLRKLLLTGNGGLRSLAHVVIEGRDISQFEGLDTMLKGIPEVSVVISVPAISGG